MEDIGKPAALGQLQQAWANCGGCNLCHDRRTVVFGYGNPDAQIMIIGEAPGENEDKAGLPFIGSAGHLLDQYLGQVSALSEVRSLVTDMNVRSKTKDDSARINGLRTTLRNHLLGGVYLTNVVMCHPLENRDPIPKEIDACKPRLLAQIYYVDPVLIITAGRIATEAIVGKKISITQNRGELYDVDIPGQIHPVRYPVLALLHPSYLLRKNDFNQRGGDGQKTYNDFIRVMNIVDKYNEVHWGMPIPETRPKMEK